MADDKKKAPATTGKDVSEGYSAFKGLVEASKKSNEQTKPADKPADPPPAPPIRTDSVGGLLTSMKDRLSYAFFGPPKADPAKK